MVSWRPQRAGEGLEEEEEEEEEVDRPATQQDSASGFPTPGPRVFSVSQTSWAVQEEGAREATANRFRPEAESWSCRSFVARRCLITRRWELDSYRGVWVVCRAKRYRRWSVSTL